MTSRVRAIRPLVLAIVGAIFTTIASTVAIANPTALDYPSAWQCDRSAFHWYCDDLPPVSPPSPPPAAATTPPPKPAPAEIPLADIRSAKAFRERIEALQDRAVMSPTPENVRAYIEAQELAMQKGALFSDVWRRVVWATPELDYSQRRPVSATAVRGYEQDRGAQETEKLRTLAAEHGLLFFFRSDCPYCHAMAPTLLELSRASGIEVLPVSMDGGGLPGLSNVTLDRGQAAKLGVTRVPAVFIASKKTGDMAPIGAGVLSLTELVSRIVTLTATRPGEQY